MITPWNSHWNLLFGMVAVGRIVSMFEFKATIVADMSQMWFIVLSILEVLFTSTWGNGPVWLIFFKRGGSIANESYHMNGNHHLNEVPARWEEKNTCPLRSHGGALKPRYTGFFKWSLVAVAMFSGWGVETRKAHGCHYYFFLFNAKVATC